MSQLSKSQLSKKGLGGGARHVPGSMGAGGKLALGRDSADHRETYTGYSPQPDLSQFF